MQEKEGGLHAVVLDLSAVPSIDASVVHDFKNMFKDHSRRCIP